MKCAGTDMARENDHGTDIPKHEIESLARRILPEIQRFFENEQCRQELYEWKNKQQMTTKEDNKNGNQ